MARGIAALFGLILLAVPSPPAWPQSATVLATGRLASVNALPVYLRLYRAYLPAGQHATYIGAATLLYAQAGDLTIAPEGDEPHPLTTGSGAFIAGGQTVKITAATLAPSDLLLFVLSPRPNQKPPLDRPAVTKEVFRTGESLPGLAAGPYEFALTRLTLPAAAPATPGTARSGAALDYVIAGSGEVTSDSKS